MDLQITTEDWPEIDASIAVMDVLAPALHAGMQDIADAAASLTVYPSIAGAYSVEDAGDGSVQIVNADRKWPWIEFGTQPHEIRPREGQYLTFPIGSSFVRVPVVHHPGTQAQHFFGDAWEAGQDPLMEQLATAFFDDWLSRIGLAA